jgi:hypothetical protein
MLDLLSFVFLALSLPTKAHGTSIGPTAILPITNANIGPDGYTRPWVHIALLFHYASEPIPLPTASFLLGEHLPALRSKGIRLVLKHFVQPYANPDAQGDTFVIDVYNQLHDMSMDVVTSIVNIPGLDYSTLFMFTFSIGTVSNNMASTLTMVLPS